MNRFEMYKVNEKKTMNEHRHQFSSFEQFETELTALDPINSVKFFSKVSVLPILPFANEHGVAHPVLEGSKFMLTAIF